MLYILLLAIGERQGARLRPNTFWSKRSAEGRLITNQDYVSNSIGDKPMPSLHQKTPERFNILEFAHFPFSTIVRGKEKKTMEPFFIKPVYEWALPPYLMPFSSLARPGI